MVLIRITMDFDLPLLTLTTSIGWMKVTVITAAPPAIATCSRRLGGAEAPAVAMTAVDFDD